MECCQAFRSVVILYYIIYVPKLYIYNVIYAYMYNVSYTVSGKKLLPLDATLSYHRCE